MHVRLAGFCGLTVIEGWLIGEAEVGLLLECRLLSHLISLICEKIQLSIVMVGSCVQ